MILHNTHIPDAHICTAFCIYFAFDIRQSISTYDFLTKIISSHHIKNVKYKTEFLLVVPAAIADVAATAAGLQWLQRCNEKYLCADDRIRQQCVTFSWRISSTHPNPTIHLYLSPAAATDLMNAKCAWLCEQKINWCIGFENVFATQSNVICASHDAFSVVSVYAYMFIVIWILLNCENLSFATYKTVQKQPKMCIMFP